MNAWRHQLRYQRRAPRATVLLVVLVITAMAALVAVSVLYFVQAESAAGTVSSSDQHAYTACMSGLQHAMTVLAESADDPAEWQDNPDVFQNVFVRRAGGDDWYFTIYAPAEGQAGEEGEFRYGLTDESGKISLLTADESVLLELPGMTQERVDALLDYRDEDDESRGDAAEQSDYYDRLAHPYRIPNGPLASVEELLLVKGFTGDIVYGEDANMNGRLDPNEDDGDESLPADSGDGRLDRGLKALVTVFSLSPGRAATDSNGENRIPLRGSANPLRDLGLSSQTFRFIEIVLADGHEFTHPSELLQMQYTLQDNQPRFGLARGAVVNSPVDDADLAVIMDRLTTSRGVLEQGLININAAPAAVLAALPGVDEQAAERIVSERGGLLPEQRTHTAWLYTEGILDAEQYKLVAPMLATKGMQYHVRVIGYGYPSGRYRVIEAVLDLASGFGSGSRTPRIMYWRDVTRSGLPFPLDPDVQENRE